MAFSESGLPIATCPLLELSRFILFLPYFILAVFVFRLSTFFVTISFDRNSLDPGPSLWLPGIRSLPSRRSQFRSIQTLSAATGCTEGPGYTEHHLVRPEPVLSESLIPCACSILGPDALLIVVSGKNNYKNNGSSSGAVDGCFYKIIEKMAYKMFAQR